MLMRLKIYQTKEKYNANFSPNLQYIDFWRQFDISYYGYVRYRKDEINNQIKFDNSLIKYMMHNTSRNYNNSLKNTKQLHIAQLNQNAMEAHNFRTQIFI